MNLDLKDKIIPVSGGAKGIGRDIVEVLAEEGAHPVIIGRTPEDNERVVQGLRDENLKADAVVAELTRPEECKAAIEQILEKYDRIDGLVNNVGVNDGVSLENGTYDEFMGSLHKGVVHYFLLAHHALPALKQSQGNIINIGSKVAETGQGGTSGYAASNGGKNALTREWAVELLPYHVRVNAIIVAEAYTPQYEKWIKTLDNPEETLKEITEKIPYEQRMTTPREIGNTAAFLISEKSSHTTGELVHPDGGYVHLDRALL